MRPSSAPDRHAWLAIVAALALVASACASGAAGDDAADTVIGPAVLDPDDPEVADPWGDGLTRVVVRWDDDAAPPPADGPSRLRAATGEHFEDVDPSHPLAGTPSEPAPADEPRPAPSTSLPEPSTPEVSAPGEVVDDHPLLDQDGVVSVVAGGDGYYQVTADLEVDEVLALPGVRGGWREQVATISADPMRGDEWYLDDTAGVAAPELWDRADGSGIVVAIIDTGVDLSHPDLVANLWTNDGEICGNGIDDDGNGYRDDCNGWDFVNGDADPSDDHGHGTHVAGTVAATADNDLGVAGVAPGARIMPLKVLNSRGSGGFFGVAQAIRYAVDHGADVINLSLGAVGARSFYMEDALNHSTRADVLVVAAAGNNAGDNDVQPVYPASYPHPNLVSVGASTQADAVAWFSNYGATSVDVFAPGDNILSTYPGGRYARMRGTSMASPVAAGVAAQLLSLDPSATVGTITDALLRGTTPGDAYAGRSVTGGRVHAPGAAELLVPGVGFDVSGLLGLEADVAAPISAEPVVHPSSDLDTSNTSVRATLLIDHDGQVRTVARHDLLVDGAPASTDDEGRVLGQVRADAPTLDLELALPAGRYGLLLELVDDAGQRVGLAGLTGFEVVGEPDPTPTTTTVPASPTTTTPDDGGDGGPTPAPTTTTTPDSGGGGGTTPAPTTTTTPSGGGGGGGGTPTVTTIPTVDPGAPTTTTPSGGGGSTSPTTPTSPTTSPTTTAPSSPTTTPGSGGGTSPTPTTPATTTPPTTGAPTTTAPGGGGGTPTTTIPPIGTEPSVGEIAISAVSPNAGSIAGGDTVVITGGDFGTQPTVLFGDRPATVLVNIAGVQLLVTTPTAPAGAVDVVVSDGSRTGTLPNGFLYLDPSGGSPGSPSTPTTTVPVPDGGAPTTTTPGDSTPSITIPDVTTTTTPVDDGGGTTPTTSTTTPSGGGTVPTTEAPDVTAPSTTVPSIVTGPGGISIGLLPTDLADLGLTSADLVASTCIADPCAAAMR